MIIKKIEIEGFGKFTDTVFEFDKGLNLIYGNNEDGKTTLMSFVKMMLYSSSAKTEKSADIFKALRKKYRPWNGSPMSGAMEFEANGMEYRLQKEFLKSDASDKTSIFCITTGENIQIENKNEPGEYFLGMSSEEFERSIFMGQSGGFTAEGASDSLAMRISNLSVSGDESISHELVLKRLADAAEELVSKSRKKGLLIDAQNRLESLNIEKQQLAQLEEEQKDIELKIQLLTDEINSLETDLNALSDLDKLENAKRDLNAFYTLYNKLNLLKAVKGQLAAYDSSYEDMQKYAAQAKELNDKIENNLTLIQEATLHRDTDISDEEYTKLCGLDQKCNQLKQDINLVNGRISTLWSEFQSKKKYAVKSAKTVALIIPSICIGMATVSAFLPPYGMIISLFLVFIAAGLFAGLFFTAEGRSCKKLAVQLSKRDYEGAIRDLLSFEEYFSQQSPSEILDVLNAHLSQNTADLTYGLNKLGIDHMEQLNAKSRIFRAENIKNITNELAVQKEDFVALSCTIKPCPTYSSAKILYIELCESLAKLKSITQEIETISTATGIENTSEDFVSNRIKELGKLIQDAPIRPTDSDTSIPRIRKSLSEKRTLLNQLQSQIKRPTRKMSELLYEIDCTQQKVRDLTCRFDEINIAIEVMSEAILDTTKGLGSCLSQKVSQYISNISGGKYSDVLVPRDLSLETRSQGSHTFHEWKYLSSGAIDKIYLALRLAMTDILADSHGALPLFLDDIFAQYDDDSCINVLNFLKKYLNDTNSVSQILFFTCHKNVIEMVRNVFSDVKNISL